MASFFWYCGTISGKSSIAGLGMDINSKVPDEEFLGK